jgi:hypothetical protein
MKLSAWWRIQLSSHAVRLTVAFLLWAGLAWASNAALYEAIRLHQDGEFTRARAALERLSTDAALSPDDQVTAAEYLASAELQMKDRPAAKATLEAMLRRYPQTRLDPELFVPELIVLAEEVRIELDRQQRQTHKAPDAPLGAGVEHAGSATGARLAGKVMLGVGVAALVAGAVLEGLAYVQYENLQQSTPPSPGAAPGPYRETGRSLQTAAQVSAAAGAAIALAGGGLLLWRPAPESAQAFFRAGPSGLAVAGSF